MDNNKQQKRFFLVSLLLFVMAYLIYDYYTNPCSIYNKFFLVNHKPIDKKYVYVLHDDQIQGVYNTSDCDKVKYIQQYYNDYNDSIIRDITSGINYIKPCSYMEILKYNYKDSIAFVKFYYSGKSQRTNKDQYTIVSMKCLHDTLPRGYTEYKE